MRQASIEGETAWRRARRADRAASRAWACRAKHLALRACSQWSLWRSRSAQASVSFEAVGDPRPLGRCLRTRALTERGMALRRAPRATGRLVPLQPESEAPPPSSPALPYQDRLRRDPGRVGSPLQVGTARSTVPVALRRRKPSAYLRRNGREGRSCRPVFAPTQRPTEAGR